MGNVRLMDLPEDYKNLGINPDKVEVWEDGKRNKDAAKHWEWWYFDAVLDDGTAVVVQFLEKSYLAINTDAATPTLNYQVTVPGKETVHKMLSYKLEERSVSKEKCDVKYGPNILSGDLENYKIHADDGEGMIVDFQMKSLTKPFRPGSAYFDFGNGDFYTWLCLVPKGEITGTLTIDGVTKEVHGFGYHDHQWGNFTYFFGWNNWTWARQKYDDYTLTLFDYVTHENYGLKRIPIVFVQDKNGDIVFSDIEDAKYEVLEDFKDELSGKMYPSKVKYIFEKDGKTLEYDLSSKKVLEDTFAYGSVPEPLRKEYDAHKIKMSYIRFLGDGKMTLTCGAEKVERNEELIYEFMYPGYMYR